MDFANGGLQMGLLLQLDRLMQQSEYLERAQDNAIEAMQNAEVLQKRAVDVREKWNEAHSLLNSKTRSMKLKEQMTKETEEEFFKKTSVDTLPGELMTLLADDLIPSQAKKRKREDLHVAHRISGRLFFAAGENLVAVQLETFYKDKYFESYFVVFRREEEESDEYEIWKHTIPYFIVSSMGAFKKKPVIFGSESEVQLFLDELHALLLSFVSRREQVMELKKKGEDRIVSIKSTPSFDTWEIEMKGKEVGSGIIHIRALFDSLKRAHPSSSRVEIVDGDERHGNTEAEVALSKVLLVDALSDLL